MSEEHNFNGKDWPWQISGVENWFSIHSADGRYISDACVEGNRAQFIELAHALRGRHDVRFKRLSAKLEGGFYRFCSPRNTLGGLAELPVDLADALADIIDTALAGRTSL